MGFNSAFKGLINEVVGVQVIMVVAVKNDFRMRRHAVW
jgi:hypothetical protein